MRKSVLIFLGFLIALSSCSVYNKQIQTKPGQLFIDPRDPPARNTLIPAEDWKPYGELSSKQVVANNAKADMFIAVHNDEGVSWEHWMKGVLLSQKLEKGAGPKGYCVYGSGFNYNISLMPPPKNGQKYYYPMLPNARQDIGTKPPKKRAVERYFRKLEKEKVKENKK